MAKKKLISFNNQNEDVYNILMSKSDASAYICEAIRAYENNFEIEKKLDVIIQILNTKQLATREEELDNDIKNLILIEDD